MHCAIRTPKSRTPKGKWQSVLNRLKTPVTGLCLSIGLVVSGMMTLPSQGADVVAMVSQQPMASDVASDRESNANARLDTQSASTQTAIALNDGVYLYGQIPEPDQIGIAYLVFEVSEHQVVGAFYMPHSSFDCFQGEFQSNQLALQITDSYEQVTFPYSISVSRNGAIAAAEDVAIPPVELAGFDPIDTVSDNDHRILGVCKTDQGIDI